MVSIISDMDGVIYRGNNLIDGAKDFVNMLLEKNVSFLFLTNNAEQTPIDLKRKLESLGIDGLEEKHFFTAAQATAKFIKTQQENGSAYVIGTGGLVSELYNIGYSINDVNPDYVVVGKTSAFNFDMLKKAVSLINKGARFIGCNPDITDPAPDGELIPAVGPILAAIETATGKKPYIVGKPNPIMMSIAKNKINAHSENTVMIGDRMDTDILGGLGAGMRTCLVLSGVTKIEMLKEFPYKPNYVFNSVAEIDVEKL
ncbi:HAD-IIA family hydrolase [Brachyspira pilosicoli]|uniref:HAD-IIA family hydrolase n=1 Tax=Brachyspira pilosicoli TaxID=52584 RepID=UPI002542CABE|nr:HAD-IIA family hydrolase [Brachyspira pilosicoli]WIH88779.1 HAD-IIA family hydrolase [Brachyspira pilosicoli]